MPDWVHVLGWIAIGLSVFWFGFGCGKWVWPAGAQATPSRTDSEGRVPRYSVEGYQGDTACHVECDECHTTEWIEVDNTSNATIIDAAERWYFRHRKEVHQ